MSALVFALVELLDSRVQESPARIVCTGTRCGQPGPGIPKEFILTLVPCMLARDQMLSRVVGTSTVKGFMGVPWLFNCTVRRYKGMRLKELILVQSIRLNQNNSLVNQAFFGISLARKST